MLLQASDESDALERLHQLGCTDGLPVIIPSPERVDRMVLATGYPAELELGVMGPNLGSCTIEKVAIAAVMAGCLPDYAPVVVAACRAVMDPVFDLTEMQATTYATAPLVIVNGPAREWCGVSSGFGALGPGHRANAAIGRALRLAMLNIGGARPGSADMALLGHGGKFTMCLAEAEDVSPLAPLHTSLGFDAEQSTVTVIGADAPHSVIGVVEADDPENADRLLESFARGFAHEATNNIALGGGQAVLALNPDHAAALAAAGHDRASIQREIAERAVVAGERLLETAAVMAPIRPDSERRAFASSDDVVVIVAGGGGLYSVVFPSWCAGPNRNRAVTVEVEVGQACELPSWSDT